MSWRPAPIPESNDEAIRQNLESWDSLAHLHAQGAGSEFYRIEQWLAGESKLAPWELEEIGSVEGKSLLHMQCHIGTDTLSWAREGAKVTGLDFSPNAISEAERFAKILNIFDAKFVVSTISDAVEVLDGEQFDILYTGRGALCWLPNLEEWAKVCSALVKPGGVLYLEESTPMLNALDVGEGTDETRLGLKYDLFNENPVSEIGEGSYASPEADIERTCHSWEYRYDTLFNALINNGFMIESLNERDELAWAPWPEMFEISRPNFWRLKEDQVNFPLSFTLKATRV
jgi:SAM-dependent methyltransferase